jgi:pimeloyl-ACP methyl ester carboxylesterase
MSTTLKKKVPALAQERTWRTRDGIRVVANLFKGEAGQRGRLIVVAPGFAKYKDAYPMTQLCQEMMAYGDVLCLDFRGVGKSEGRYTFGGEEYLDLEPILGWGRGRYEKVVLLGLSLGSYHSLRAAHAWPELVDKLLLVSVPSKLEDVLKTFGPLRQGWAIATDLKALRKRLSNECNIFFRWGNPLSNKPDASHLAPGLRVPTDFLVGGRDRLVVKSLSRKVYEGTVCQKSWTEIPEGNHAEFLYVEQPEQFKGWLQKNLEEGWRNEKVPA